MTERDRSKVTLELSESDARALLLIMRHEAYAPAAKARILDELRHALAECDCAGEVGR